MQNGHNGTITVLKTASCRPPPEAEVIQIDSSSEDDDCVILPSPSPSVSAPRTEPAVARANAPVESPSSSESRPSRRVSTIMLPPVEPQPGPSHSNLVQPRPSSRVEKKKTSLKRRRSSTKSLPRRSGVNGTAAGSHRTEEKRLMIERQIVGLMQTIDAVDQEEVDLDDDVNSSYILKDRLTKKLLSSYEKLAEYYGYNGKLTDRPMQKRFRVEQVTKYPEIDSAIEAFLNNFCKFSVKNKKEVAYATPEYNDILDVVSKTIAEKHIVVVEGEQTQIALELFKYVVKEYKRRRAKELGIAIPKLYDKSTPQSDPAETNDELKKQLADNVRLRRTEEQVLSEYAEKQALQPDQTDQVDEEDDDDEEDEENQVMEEETEEDLIGVPVL